MKTDAQLKTDVMVELRWEPTLSANDINIAMSIHRAVQVGTEANYDEKWGHVR